MKIDNLDDRATQASLGRIVGVSREGISKHAPSMPQGGTLREWLLVYCEKIRMAAAGRGGDDQYELTQERARLAHHQANKTALEEDELRGSLVRVEYVSSLWSTLAGNIKNKMRGIPHKVAHKLEAAEDFQEILEILTIHIDEALVDLSDGELLTNTDGIDEEATEPASEADS